MVAAILKILHGTPLVLVLLDPWTAACAHQLDEYLQATLVEIDPAGIRLHVNLTPGVEVADQVLDVIDQNRDGAISSAEAAQYADVIRRDLTVLLDGRDVELDIAAANIPKPSVLRTGWAVMQMEFSLPLAALTAGAHKLTFENRHMRTIGEYLFNAARPQSELVRIIRQHRRDDQSRGEIEFAFDRRASNPRIVVFVVVYIATVAAVSAILGRLAVAARKTNDRVLRS